MNYDILYFTYSRIPSRLASSNATVYQCEALAQKASLLLIAFAGSEELEGVSLGEFYGVKPFPIRTLSIGLLKDGHEREYASTVLEIVRECEPHLIYSRDIFVNMVLTRSGIPSIYEIHQLVHENKTYTSDFVDMLRTILKYPSLCGFVYISQALKKQCVSRGYVCDRMIVLRSGVRATLRQRDNSWGRQGRGIVYCGSLQRGKGIDVFLSAAKLLPEEIFAIVGGDADAFTGYLPFNVSHIPWVYPINIAKAISGYDIAIAPYVMQSYVFYSPLKIVEYMALGKAVIASSTPGIGEIIEDGVTGLLVNPGDIEMLVSAIRSLRATSGLLNSIACHAYAATASMTWDVRAQRILDFSSSF